MDPEERKLGLYNVCLWMFGHQDFRGVQADALLEWGVRRRDAVVVWRTGGGKTAIFAIPAIFHDGLTVVVLPLISLIEDVVRKLEESLWIASGAIGGYIVDL